MFFYQKKWIKNVDKGCISLFNHFIDMSPTLMSPFFVKKHVFEGKKDMDFFLTQFQLELEMIQISIFLYV